jgi:hypothetical protein
MGKEEIKNVDVTSIDEENKKIIFLILPYEQIIY